MINIEDIKRLRDETGASPVKIKKAMEESGEDVQKAKELLKSWGAVKAGEKGGRETHDGVIDFYIHPNAKSGVLLDIRCETDFVAKNPDFKSLAHEICLHIAAMQPENVEALLAQSWVKDDAKTIKSLIEETVAKIGENITVKQFARFAI
ncbi:MAG: translation elongation factor Ts [Candidatus Staskawiczbacteria bacterium RIFCSPHIGHO2_02_FULL_43_16]|uniref:Elongation factor Ts n=1 Tax=Candidatus Staskawiczbacteria bacterium RIFCSPHIGHO2_01_FULL_41_41 TaxID=1802203 RepID=A0A1G2HTG0_9BACT|nr:MAG: translation elongation factor Ts [Candidatus Staskawiczbacteria bacterium RIFCSPHIGHO2_01_FULL_41_41]OGZ68337.1 MAG: translation elongation factor Ts [Candidatus Staskawiczbacteria bacterium RIFCSPHIGHO2_02_FULL_43_16]OGZ75128.1 MAG: translation elongation factor Ts [Candidatus Staskawiczbacteria bacterium RIFCSPLOWO2_01_FULL_43_17b]